MIKIKQYIISENEIDYIKEYNGQIEIYKNNKIIITIDNAKIEDIIFKYETKEKRKTLEEEFEEYNKNKKIEKVYHCSTSTENSEIEFVVDNINFMVDKINELIEHIEALEGEE